MIKFADLLVAAQLHRGGRSELESILPEVKSSSALADLPDSFYLSEMSRRVFRAGLRHSVIDAKWPAFELAFMGFDPFDVSMMSDDVLEAQMQNRAIIRHLGKIRSVRVNAQMVRELSLEYDGFGRFLAQWPEDDIVGLWLLLKKRGSQLGGMSASRFLRMVGKDTFLLTDDVVAVLISQSLLSKKPTAQRDMRQAQEVFSEWQQQSGLPLSHISKIVSCTADILV